MTRFLIFFLVGIIPTSLFAINGSNLLGISPVSNALGGTGVAKPQNGTDAIFKNPATLIDVNGKTGQWGIEMTNNLIKNNASANGGIFGEKSSTAAARLLPALTATYKLDEKIALGLEVVGHGGAVVDYKTQGSLSELKTDHQLLRVLPTVSYRPLETFSVGLSPIVAYSSLSLNSGTGANQSGRQPHGATAFGFQLGASSKPIEKLSIGASFTSKTGFNYKDIIVLGAYGPNAATDTGLSSIKLEQPMEAALGVAYTILEKLNLYADYRFIQWSKADAYKELGWNDQNVIAFGAEYGIEKWSLRAGFNYGKSPIASISGESGLTPAVSFQGHQVFPQSLSNLNMIAFPAFAESHVTFGLGYAVTENLNVDSAFMYAFKKTATRSGTNGLPAASGGPTYSFTGNVSQWLVGLGISYLL